jgi:hypothetical protein
VDDLGLVVPAGTPAMCIVCGDKFAVKRRGLGWRGNAGGGLHMGNSGYFLGCVNFRMCAAKGWNLYPANR